MPPRKRKANKSKAKVPEVANDETNDQQTAEMVPDVHDDPDDIGGLDGGNNADVDNDVDIDHDDAAIHGQPEKKKRIYKTTNLTEDQEADMVEWLKSNPILFNNRMKGFREKIPKQQLWEEQARRLGKTAHELETWYSSLRTRYTRIKNANTKSGSGVPDMTDRDKWVWENFEFLKPYIGDVKRRNAVSVSTPTYIFQYVIHSTHCFGLIVRDWWDGVNDTAWPS